MPGPTRRGLVGLLAAGAAAPGTAFAIDDRPCDPPRYEGWTEKRAKRWPERVGAAGFVNYYGEAFSYDDAIDLPLDTLPSCEIWGADASTLDNGGAVRDHLKDEVVRGVPASTNCDSWPSRSAEDLETTVAVLVNQLRATCLDPVNGSVVRFHAVGAHHSSSDVYKRADATKSVVVRIEGLNQIQLQRPEWRPAIEMSALRPHADDPVFALVGAGIHVCQLNEALWERGLALETQGSFDGQTIAGAISTGTHGAGSENGTIADSLEAVIVATAIRGDDGAAKWVVLQIEPDPEDAISVARDFPKQRAGVDWHLVQDSKLFDAAIIGLGTLGIIVAYVVRVRSAYFLRELRLGRPWTEVRENLVERATTPATGFTDQGWRYELVVNPNATSNVEDWVCTEVYRDAWTYDLDYLSEVRDIPQKWAGGLTRNVNLGGQLGNVVSRAANGGLAKGARVGAFADRCYRVLKLGQGEFVQAWGCEYMIPAERASEMVDWVLATNPQRGRLGFGERRGERLLNPFGVRFCRGRRGYLSPLRRLKDNQHGLVCTAELTEAVKNNDAHNLGVQENGKPTSKAILEWWADAFVKRFGADARLHWGQIQGDFREANLLEAYPKEDVDAWFAAFCALNPFGLFDNAAANRLGFVARRASAPAKVRYRGWPA